MTDNQKKRALALGIIVLGLIALAVAVSMGRELSLHQMPPFTGVAVFALLPLAGVLLVQGIHLGQRYSADV